jgi:hypothetical protein
MPETNTEILQTPAVRQGRRPIVKTYSPKLDETMTFGLEIEFLSPINGHYEIATRLRELTGLLVSNYSGGANSWTVKGDGSVHTNRHQANLTGNNEIVSPILKGENGIQQVALITKALREIGCQVNSTCGIHVHHGIKSFFNNENNTSTRLGKYLARVLAAYARFEGALDWLVPPSRRADNAYYCHSVRLERSLPNPPHLNSVISWCGSRYRKLNLEAYFRHHTIEVRHFGGSLNTTKITSWIWLTQRLVARALTDDDLILDNRKSFNDLLEYVGVTADSRDPDYGDYARHIARRFKKNVEAAGRTLEEAIIFPC